jgi:hypothetical protein
MHNSIRENPEADSWLGGIEVLVIEFERFTLDEFL